MKEIELQLMSTEDELRGQPSRPVSRVQMCLCALMCDSTIYVHVRVTLALRTVVEFVCLCA